MEKQSVGELLRKRREELSLTQRQIANEVGVTESTVSRWESGDIDNMRRDKIARLANALKVSPLLIMGIENSEQYCRPINREELELLDDYRDVGVDDRNMIRGILRRFKLSGQLVVGSQGVVNNNLGGNNFIAVNGGNNYSTMTP